jgi:branched-chain amino acid transport system ATP-binding protein
MLKVENLTVRYGQISALREVSLRVGSGELVGVIGPNGAGKSSLLLTIAGALAPKSGTITLEGESIVGDSPESLVRRGVALVPERRRIFTQLTVEENLRVGESTRRRGDPEVKADFEELLEKFPILRNRLHASARTLSGGEQQQLAIARSLLPRPRLLLVDEPSLGLAPRMVDLIFSVLEDLRRERVTVLLVEQNAIRTAELADRVYVLRGGTIVASGTGKDVLKSVDLSGVYLGGAGGGAADPAIAGEPA